MKEIGRRLIGGIWRTGVADEGSGGSFNGGTITDPLVIAPDSAAEGVPLQIEAPVAATDVLTAKAADDTVILVVNVAGIATLRSLSGGEIFILRDASNYALFSVTDGDGTPALQIWPGFDTITLKLGAGGTGASAMPVLQILGGDNNPAFEVRANGSIHIRTGASVIPDL